MSAERTGTSHAIVWTIAMLVVPVLYLLSYPPLEIYCLDGFNSEPTGWLEVYGDPIRWLLDNTQFGSFFYPYHEWWRNLMLPWLRP